jgi:hypothetical protein
MGVPYRAGLTPLEPPASRSGCSSLSLLRGVGRPTFPLVRRRVAPENYREYRPDAGKDGPEDRYMFRHDVHASSMDL